MKFDLWFIRPYYVMHNNNIFQILKRVAKGLCVTRDKG